MKYNNEEMQVIIKYEMDKIIDKLLEQVQKYDCSDNQEFCRERGKSEESCRAVQATTQLISDKLIHWEMYS